MPDTRGAQTARHAWLAYGLACVLAAGAAVAQTGSGVPPIDNSGDSERERAACLAGNTPQERDTCLREVTNAAAAKRQGDLRAPAQEQMQENAMRRCDVLSGEEHAACAARVLGYGNQSGSVGGGGVLREVETVVVPPGQSEVTIEPKTAEPVLIVPR